MTTPTTTENSMNPHTDIDWAALNAQAQKLADEPSTSRYAQRVLADMSRRVQRELDRVAVNPTRRKFKSPLSYKARALFVRLIEESEQRLSDRADQAKDAEGNILHGSLTAEPWHPPGALGAVARFWYEARQAGDKDAQRQAFEVTRSLLSHNGALSDWLSEAAESRGVTVADIVEKLGLERAVAKGRLTSMAQAKAILGFVPGVWTCTRVGEPSYNIWGTSYPTVLQTGPEGDELLLFWWAGRRLEQGARYTIDAMNVKAFREGRDVRNGRSYPGSTSVSRVVVTKHD